MSDVSERSQNVSGVPLACGLGCSPGVLDTQIHGGLEMILFTDEPDGTHVEVAGKNNQLH
jgi:hypothetical protein